MGKSAHRDGTRALRAAFLCLPREVGNCRLYNLQPSVISIGLQRGIDRWNLQATIFCDKGGYQVSMALWPSRRKPHKAGPISDGRVKLRIAERLRNSGYRGGWGNAKGEYGAFSKRLRGFGDVARECRFLDTLDID